MPTLQERNEDRALHRWARRQGYADFETYVRTGGSLLDARRSLEHDREMATWGLQALARLMPPPEPSLNAQQLAADAALARAVAEAAGHDEALIQGFDDGSP